MKKNFAIVFLLITFLGAFFVSCNSRNNPVSSEITETASPTNTSTPTDQPTPTFTASPTITPTATPTEHPGWMPEGAITRIGKGVLRTIAASPTDSIVAIGAAGGVYLTDPTSGRVIDFLDTGTEVYDLKFSSDGTKLFMGLGVNGVEQWNQNATGNWVRSEKHFNVCSHKIAVSPENDLLITKCILKDDMKLIMWDIESQRQLFQQNNKQKEYTAFAMAFHPTEHDIVAIAYNASISFFDVKNGTSKKVYYQPDNQYITDIDFSPDGTTLSVVTDSNQIIYLGGMSLEEQSIISHTYSIYALEFISNDKILMQSEGNMYVENKNGSVLKRINKWVDPRFAYIPTENMIALHTGFDAEYISLDDYESKGKTSGFAYTNWRQFEASGDGSTVLGSFFASDYLLINDNSPNQFAQLSANDVCSGASWINFFDSEGKYFYIECPKQDSFRIYDFENTDITFSAPMPMVYRSNTNINDGNIDDELSLLALLYKTEESEKGYSLKIWKPLDNELFSEINIELADDSVFLIFSSNSKFIGVFPRGKYLPIQIFDIENGNLVQSIAKKDNMEFSYQIINDTDMLFFLVRDGSLEIYSLESGKLLQSYYNLKSGDNKDGWRYFEDTNTLVWYYTITKSSGQVIYFDYYNVETGEKILSRNIDLPISTTDPYFEDGKTYRGRVYDVHFHPENNGMTAVINATIKPSMKWNKNYFFIVDIENSEIIKQYDFFSRSDLLSSQTPVLLDNSMYQRLYDTIFKWDVSIE